MAKAQAAPGRSFQCKLSKRIVCIDARAVQACIQAFTLDVVRDQSIGLFAIFKASRLHNLGFSTTETTKSPIARHTQYSTHI